MSDILQTNISALGVATVTLNRPDVHNAFNDALIAEMTRAFLDLGSSDDVRIIILHGAGKSFCAGGDLNWMKAAASYTYEENVADAMRLSNLFATINDCPKPVIGAIHGAAFGGGVGVIACLDIALAVPTAKFSLSEVKLGLTPATISPFVVAAIGERNARRYFLTAERFDAEIALQIGLVHEICDDPMEKASALADVILQNAPGAVSEAKALINAIKGKEITDELRADTAERIAKRRATDEGKEGLAAFLERRSPNWSIKS